MKRIYYFCLISCLTVATTIQGQYSELGASIGLSNYLGDLVPPQSYFLGTNLAGGAFYQYHFTNRISAKGQVLLGKLSGDDRFSSYDSGRRQRNLSFESVLFETSLIGQVYILPFHPRRKKRPVSPYVFAGVALFHYNPSTQYRGQDVFLQPLGTEGQGMEGYSEPYALWGLSIPMGAGIKFDLGKRWMLGFELGLRKTFTDYIDDVSSDYVALAELRAGNGDLAAALSNRTYNSRGEQIERVGIPRGNPNTDWYIFTSMTISYRLNPIVRFK